LSQLLSKVTVTSCSIYITCSIYPPCCWRRTLKICCFRSRIFSSVALKTLAFHKVV